MDWAALKERLERYSDIFLTVGVLLIVSLMVVRIPPEYMDYLIAANLSISILILLVAMSIKDAIKLPSFPNILLLTTLFRLALNVSTTRLILLEANAGDIIYGFGNVVVGGNFVVGGVVFVVLVLIQFIVIAKGSERAAEVAARFTLDAMAGKQSSIDFDLQQQLITPDEARKRRKNLEREAKLYGAMDGAMKFVKGDAIAGIIISLVNVIGGLIIGVMQQGMEAGEAAQIYSLLTIGDGLVSQLPALFISVSAGIVITRVAARDDDDKPSNLGRDILAQLFENPSALKIGAGTFVIIGLLTQVVDTGFPSVPFLLVGGCTGLLALMVWRPEPEAAFEGEWPPEGGPVEGEERVVGAARMFLPAPFVIEHHESLEPILGLATGEMPETAAQQLAGQLDLIRDTVSRELGVTLPPIHVRTHRRSVLTDDEYVFYVYDGLVYTDRWRAGTSFVARHPDELDGKGIGFEPVMLAGRRVRGCYVDSQDAEKVANLDGAEPAPVFGYDEVFFRQVQFALERNAWQFQGIQETQNLIAELKREHDELVAAVMAKKFTPQEVTDVLQELLREQVSIADIRRIFEALARWAHPEKNLQAIVEHVRRELGRALYDRYATAGRAIQHYQLGEEFEQMLSQVHAGRRLVLNEIVDLRQAISSTVDGVQHLRIPAVIMTRLPEIRPWLRKYIEDVMPEIAVLTLQDMPIEFDAVTIGMITEDAVMAADAE